MNRVPKNQWKSKKEIHNEYGFTLIETLVLIIFIGILTAISIPRIGSIGMQAARATSRQVMADMRYTRRLAISSARNHIIRFSPSGGTHTSYSIFRVDEAGETLVGCAKQIREEVTCTGPDEFIFYPFGNASTNGTVSLIAESEQFDVHVVATTGRVH